MWFNLIGPVLSLAVFLFFHFLVGLSVAFSCSVYVHVHVYNIHKRTCVCVCACTKSITLSFLYQESKTPLILVVDWWYNLDNNKTCPLGINSRLLVRVNMLSNPSSRLCNTICCSTFATTSIVFPQLTKKENLWM